MSYLELMSRERGLSWTSESRHWSAGIKTLLRAVRQLFIYVFTRLLIHLFIHLTKLHSKLDSTCTVDELVVSCLTLHHSGLTFLFSYSVAGGS